MNVQVKYWTCYKSTSHNFVLKRSTCFAWMDLNHNIHSRRHKLRRERREISLTVLLVHYRDVTVEFSIGAEFRAKQVWTVLYNDITNHEQKNKREGGLLTFFPWKEGGGLIRERGLSWDGELNRRFIVYMYNIKTNNELTLGQGHIRQLWPRFLWSRKNHFLCFLKVLSLHP